MADDSATVPLLIQAPTKLAPNGMNVSTSTAPVLFSYRGHTRIYYAGSGTTGVCYSELQEGDTWGQAQSIVPGINPYVGIDVNSSPCVVSFNNYVYVLYRGNGNDGIFYTSSSDATEWATPAQLKDDYGFLGIFLGTSPSVVLDSQKNLYVFYSGSAGNGIYLSISTTYLQSPMAIQNRVAVQSSSGRLLISDGTSPCAGLITEWSRSADSMTCTKSDTICLLYTSLSTTQGNLGKYSIFCSSAKIDATNQGVLGDWSVPVEITSTSGTVLKGTSPTCEVIGTTIHLFWMTAGGLASAVSFDSGASWLTASNLDTSSYGVSPYISSSVYENMPVVLWTTVGGYVAYGAFTPVFDPSSSTLISEMVRFYESGSRPILILTDESDRTQIKKMIPGLSGSDSSSSVTLDSVEDDDGDIRIEADGALVSLNPLDSDNQTLSRTVVVTLSIVTAAGLIVWYSIQVVVGSLFVAVITLLVKDVKTIVFGARN